MEVQSVHVGVNLKKKEYIFVDKGSFIDIIYFFYNSMQLKVKV